MNEIIGLLELVKTNPLTENEAETQAVLTEYVSRLEKAKEVIEQEEGLTEERKAELMLEFMLDEMQVAIGAYVEYIQESGASK